MANNSGNNENSLKPGDFNPYRDLTEEFTFGRGKKKPTAAPTNKATVLDTDSGYEQSLYAAFAKLVSRVSWKENNISDQSKKEIADFIGLKNEILTKYPDLKDKVENQITRYLDGKDDLIYGSELIDPKNLKPFADAYRAADDQKVSSVLGKTKDSDNQKNTDSIFVKEEDVYARFVKLVDYEARGLRLQDTGELVTAEDIKKFVAKKDAFLAQHPELSKVVNDNINQFLDHTAYSGPLFEIRKYAEGPTDNFLKMWNQSKDDSVKTLVPNMLFVAFDNRGYHSTLRSDIVARLDNVDAESNELNPDRLKRMVVALKQAYGELSNQEVLDSFASDDFKKMQQQTSDEDIDALIKESAFDDFKNKINGNADAFRNDDLAVLYRLHRARKVTDGQFSLNQIVQTPNDVAVAKYLADKVYGYNDPTATENKLDPRLGEREDYQTINVVLRPDPIVVGPTPEPTPRPQPGPEPEPEPGPQPGPDGDIISGYTSDEWKQIIDGSNDGNTAPVFLEAISQALDLHEGIEISALREVLGSNFPSDFKDLSKEEKEIKIKELRDSLSPAQLTKFNIKLSEDASKLAEMLPPHQLVVMAQNVDDLLKKYKNSSNEEIKANLVTLQEQKNLIVQAMLNKTKGVKDGDIIVDEYNVADVHDGAMEMFDYLVKEAEKKNEQPAPEINIARQIIAAQILSYDDKNGLKDIKPEDEEDIEKSFDEAWKIVSEINYEEAKGNKESGFYESSQMFDCLEFEGTPEEAKAKKETFIDTIKLEAARNTAIKGRGKTGDELKKLLNEELKAVCSAHLGVLTTADDLANLPENATEQQRKETIEAVKGRFGQVLSSGTKFRVSDAGVIAYQAATVNNHISFLNRLAGKAHLDNRAAPILSKLYAPLKKIDQTCIARFGKPYEIARTFGMMVKGNMASQGLNQVLRIGCNYGALALGMPGVGNYIYTAVYAGMAISRFYKAYRDEKAGDPNFSTAKWFLQKTPEIALTAAGVAASFFGGAIAEKGLEVAVRYGMMGVGLLTSFGKGINAARKEGNGWWKSIGKAALNAASSTGSALLTGACLSGGLNFASTHFGFGNTHAETFSTENHKHSDVQTVDKDGIIKGTDWFGEHGTRHISADEYNPDDASYTKDLANNPDDYKNMTPEELNSNGILQEDISADKANDLIGISNEDLAKDGIVREIIAEEGFNPEEHPNAIKIVDEPATSEYKEGVVENAEKIVKYWTSSNPEVHQSNMAAYADENSALSQWNKTHDFKMDPNRIELIIGDCGGQMVAADVDTLTEHIDTTVPEEYRQSAIVQTIMHTYSADTEVHYTYDPERGILMMDASYDSNAHREIPFNMNTVTMADYKSLEALIGSEAMEHLKENGECDATLHSEHTESTTKETNEHAVEGNHKVFGRAWLETYGEKLGLTDDDIKAIASCHDENGKLIQEKLTPQVLEKIAIIDAFVSNNNEVGDVEATRPGAHNDGVLNRNVVIDENGRHVHSDENPQKFNTYANSNGSRQETPEKAHYEEFKQYSKVEQHSFIPFTVTFDRMWGGCKSAFNTIMGANGKRKEQINAAGERTQSASSKPVAIDRSTSR